MVRLMSLRFNFYIVGLTNTENPYELYLLIHTRIMIDMFLSKRCSSLYSDLLKLFNFTLHI